MQKGHMTAYLEASLAMRRVFIISSATGRTSMLPNRAGGHFDAMRSASLKSRASISRKPPTCSLGERAVGGGQLVVAHSQGDRAVHALQRQSFQQDAAFAKGVRVREGFLYQGIALALVHGPKMRLVVAAKAEVFHVRLQVS